jgi:hypothetical protein
VEAVIFNIRTHLESVDSSPGHSDRPGRRSEELLMVTMGRKVELVHYYLKYCTINSQAKNRPAALEAGKRSI